MGRAVTQPIPPVQGCSAAALDIRLDSVSGFPNRVNFQDVLSVLLGRINLPGQATPGPSGLAPVLELDRAASRNIPAKNLNVRKPNITNPPQAKT